MLRHVVLVRTDVSEERIAYIISVLRLLVTANDVPILLILAALMMEAKLSSETSVLTKAIRRRIPEDGIFYTPVSKT
jgi:hypothetical protein